MREISIEGVLVCVCVCVCVLSFRCTEALDCEISTGNYKRLWVWHSKLRSRSFLWKYSRLLLQFLRTLHYIKTCPFIPYTIALTFIKSEKGKRKLCDEENYVYEKHQDNPTKTKTYWRCELFYTGCKARIHTPYNCDEPASVFRSGGHTHPASCAKAEARIAVNSMRDAVHAGCATSTR